MANARAKEQQALEQQSRAIVETTWSSHCDLHEPVREIRCAPERVDGYDWVRFIAAVNIVAFHVVAPTSGLIGRGGVSSFLMIAGSLPAMRSDLGPFGAFARRRATRVIVPWLGWSAFYGAIAGIRYLRHGTVPNWTINNLFIGTAIHLWFFPVVYGGTLIAWLLLRATRSWSAARAALRVSGLGALLFALYAFTFSGAGLPSPYGQWIYSLPALVIGVGLGLAWRQRQQPWGRLLIAAISGLAISAAIVNLIFGQTRDGISYIVSGLFVPASLLLPLRSNRFLKGFSNVAMGVYAAHPFIFLILRSISGESMTPVWCSVVVVVVSAIAFTKFLRRIPYAKALV